MAHKDLEKNSKYLALLLRHKPETGNCTLDENGWCEIKQLTQNTGFAYGDLMLIVKNDNKQRYELSPDKSKIRARQGHSSNLSIDAQLEKTIPPPTLYHGTKKNVEMSIAKQGLLPMNREHVHMTMDLKTARETADRRKGPSIIMEIDAMSMSANGYKFYKSSNNTFFTNDIPPDHYQQVYPDTSNLPCKSH